MTPDEQYAYDAAVKRVKKIKGFYSHLLVYVIVNLLLIVTQVQGLDEGESLWQFRVFSTAFFWGIGLVAHGLSVFIPEYFLGKEWENRNFKAFMDEEQRQQGKSQS